MDGSEHCKEIEKCIKDMIFKTSGCGNPISPSREKKPGLSRSHFPPDNRCFVSQIEKTAHLPTSDVNPPFGGISSSQVGASELIDLNVLTNFAAQHIEDSHFSPSDLGSKEIKPPHPDLEDGFSLGPKNGEQNQNIAAWISCITKEIQSSPNFLKMPENPLPQMIGSPLRSQVNGPRMNNVVPPFSKQKDSTFDKKDSKKKKRKKKEKKVKNSLQIRELPGDPVDDVSEELKDNNIKSPVPILQTKDTKTLEKQRSVEKQSCIKLKKDVFASIGKEYSFFKNEGHFKFQCHMCNWNNDSIDSIVNHISSKNHCAQKTQNDMDMMLSFLPEPLKPQVEAINDLLSSIVSTFGLQDSDMGLRNKLFIRLKKYVESHIPGCSLDKVGSTAFNCGLKSCEVDFVLNVGPNQDVPDSLEALYELMVKDASFDKVVNDFKKKRPRIIFVDHETNLPCYILIDNGSSLKIANLLSVYFKLDERVKTLGVALRYWAQICRIDDQESGTFPSFSFALLLVHFLQQVQPPVLPVLHEVENYSSTTEFYEEYISNNKWKSQNTDSVGQLWIKLFQYYNFEYKIGETVVCIKSSKKVFCNDKSWKTKFYAVEDPFVKRNVAYVIPTYQVCQFIHQCFVRTYRYFAYPQLKEGSLNLLKTEHFDALHISEYAPNTITLKEGSDESDESDNEESVLLNTNVDLEDHDPEISLDDLVSTITNLSLSEVKSENRGDKHQDSEVLSSQAVKDENSMSKKQGDKEVPKNISKIDNPICYWDLKGQHYVKEDFKYEFLPVTFRGEKNIPMTCKLCKESGHRKKDCPSVNLPPVKPLPKMNPDFMGKVSVVLNSIRDRNAVGKKDINNIESHMKEVEACIKNVYPDATLKLFGSYCNGFGFRSNSDMDFCLTFEGHNDGKNLDSIDIIKKVSKQLKSHPELDNVLPITSAKVPIVKFSWKKSGIEADISLYNTLALVNTEMLEAYSKIDPRVQVLGYALKYFAKLLGICDASRGSLSSYAYILMVIFFLQQRNPPVIPVLQELYTEEEKPTLKVEECNVWFCREINKLKEIWKDYGKNKESVGELWLGLLNFYTCEFDWKEYVVSIKQKRPLTRFKKLWQTTQLAIEDPFDLNHNLGAGLSKKMNTYILKAFIKARERFGTPIFVDKLEPYLFQRHFLNSGCEPPQDRGCGNCGKIGHLARECREEKICSYCRKPGHLAKNCPKKRGDNKKQPKEKQRSRGGQNMEPKDKDRRMMNYNQNFKNDYKQQRPYPQALPPDVMQAKLVATGIPSHRFPGPGFPGAHRPMVMSKPPPPPGFMGGFTAPFGGLDTSVPPPFPRNKNEMSPPKQFSSSPPKNYSPNKSVFHPQSDSWPVVRPGFSTDRHPGPMPRRNPQAERQQQMRGQPWAPADRLLPRFNTSKNRTNVDGSQYNSNHSDRWHS